MDVNGDGLLDGLRTDHLNDEITIFIGNGDGNHREAGHGMGPCMLHNPSYDFNDDLIPLGATAWVRLAEKWLATPR